MDTERLELYGKLEREIGNTPLYEVSKIELPGENRVFAKEENKNPGGSHYDRVFAALFRHYEEKGKIVPNVTPVVETTSGSAGISFARLGRLLGYECLVICPEDLPEARLRGIRTEGAELRLTPKERYVDGTAEELGRIVRIENRKRKSEGKKPYFALNHTQSDSALISATSVEPVVDEAVQQAAKKYGCKFDIAIASSGNGTTVLGFGRSAKRHGFPLVVWESLGSGLYFDRLYGAGSFEKRFGVKPGMRHKVYGTAYGPTVYPLPNLDRICEEDLVDSVIVIADEDTRPKALEQVKGNLQRYNLSRLASWEPAIELLRDVESKPVGRSSAGCFAVLLEDHFLKGMNILTFFYDDLSRY